MDGTTTTVTVLITGSNDPAVLSPASKNLVETNAVLTTGGVLPISDVDSPALFVAQAATAGTYGTFSLDAAGTWSWTASSAHDAFVGGTTYSDSFVVSSADGTTTSVTVNVLGTNDSAVLSSAVKNLVETNAALTTGGALTVSDVDSAAVFVAQAATMGTYGTFSLGAAGTWSWTAFSAHDSFVGGTTYSDSFVASSADGTTTTVTVNVLGTNDVAVLSPTVKDLVETDAVLSTGGVLAISDVDSPALFVTQAATVGTYGTFTIDAAGKWSWTASSSHDAFVGETTYSDSFAVSSVDGTTTTVTVAILGTNDAAVLTSAVKNLVETNAVLTTGGVLTVSDVDSPATFVVQAATAGTYGTFTLDAAGVWSWTASSAHDAFVGGTTYSDSFVVSSADGTSTSVTVNVLGTNDAAILSSAVKNLVETNAVLSTGGVLAISDVDSPALFVAQAATVGTYGTFSLDAAGNWSWTASSAHDAFVGGTTYSDSFVVSSADGTTTKVTIDILGTNDPAVLSSAVANLVETNAVLSTGDALTISDVDSPALFMAQATAGTYGTFTIDAAGNWSWIAASALDALVGGTPYADSFTVASADGTTTTVTVNILGTNDPAVLSSAVKNLVETNAVLTTGGVLAISDVDSAATFVAQAATVGKLGTFSIDTAGTWSWIAASAHDAFAGGTTYSDSFVVSSADGTTTTVTIDILGTNDPAVLTLAVKNLVETNAVLTTGGVLAISDVDSPATFVAQAATVGKHGTFTLDTAGTWSWTAASAHDAFEGGTTYSDSFTVSSADGTTTTVTIDILGTNDPAVLSPAVKNLVETNAVLSTGGVLAISDVDSPATFVAQAATVGKHGTFTLDTAGTWSWTAASAHDAFEGGTTYSDSFTVSSADGTTTTVTIDILGTNDPAVLSPAVKNLVETNAVLLTGGVLPISDVDSPATFVPQLATAGTYGTFSIGAGGLWLWVAASAHNAFEGGKTYADSFTVASADGTTTTVTVNILGTNDPAVLSPAVKNLVETNAVLTTGGVLPISDVDSPAAFVVQAATVGTYGTFTLDAAGTWSWTAASAHDAFVGGTTYSDSFVVASADGTTTTVTVNILGTNDPALITGDVAGAVAENGTLVASGDLDAADVDSPSTFVAQVSVATLYGTFSIAADGAWTYALDNDAAAVRALLAGQVVHDLVTVATADGTTQAIDITITGSGTVDLTFLAPSAGFVIQGDAAGDQAGYSVSSAGDVNGDGYADLLVGARLGDDGGGNAGEAYVVFGRTSGFGTVDGSGRTVIDLTNLGRRPASSSRAMRPTTVPA